MSCLRDSMLLWTLLNPHRLHPYFCRGQIKLLRYVNAADPEDQHGVLRLHDFFYFKASH